MENGGGRHGFYHAGSIDAEMRRPKLLKDISQGNEASFEEFYNEFLDQLYRYLRVRFADEHVIKDTIQKQTQKEATQVASFCKSLVNRNNHLHHQIRGGKSV
jgi:hypothetical protein